MAACPCTPLSDQEARAYLTQAGFRSTALETMLAIGYAESGLCPCALGGPNGDGSYDHGWLQINDKVWPAFAKTAYDPQSAAVSAYSISKGGVYFGDWTTYTNNKFSKYIRDNATPSPTMTVEQVFDSLKLEKWWQEDHANYFGQPGELGQDYGMSGGFNTPVGAIWGGTVLDVITTSCGGNSCGLPSSVGYTVRLSTSDGLHHYQHLRRAKVKAGDVVQVGTVVGYSGGCPENGYPSGFQCCGCTCYDGCSEGNHIEVRWSPGGFNPQGGSENQGWKNPLQHFRDMAKTTANSASTTDVALAGIGQQFAISDIKSTFKAAKVKISPNANVAAFFAAIDYLQSFHNPFDVSSESSQLQDTISLPLGVSTSFTDPTRYVEAVALNIGQDIIAFVIDTGLIFTGIYVCWKVFNKVIDIQGAAQKAGSTAIQVAPLFMGA